MSKITNDGLTRSGIGCFVAVPILWYVGVKGLKLRRRLRAYSHCGIVPCDAMMRSRIKTQQQQQQLYAGRSQLAASLMSVSLLFFVGRFNQMLFQHRNARAQIENNGNSRSFRKRIPRRSWLSLDEPLIIIHIITRKSLNNKYGISPTIAPSSCLFNVLPILLTVTYPDGVSLFSLFCLSCWCLFLLCL